MREAGRSGCYHEMMFASILAVVFLAAVAHGQSTATMNIQRLAASDCVTAAHIIGSNWQQSVSLLAESQFFRLQK